MSEHRVPGFYGKLPGLGDFVSRRLPRSFVDPWDGWLQAAIAASREQLGEGWLEAYLTSPLWRFALSPSVCGEHGWIGTMMPSVDRVGRYFPAAVVARLDAGESPLSVPGHYETWFAGVESRLLATLDEEEGDFELDAFDAALAGDVLPRARSAAAPTGGPEDLCASWRVPMDSVGHAAAGFLEVLGSVAGTSCARVSLWWSDGSERVGPSLLACPGLPPAEGYTALLADGWARYGWRDMDIRDPRQTGDESP